MKIYIGIDVPDDWEDRMDMQQTLEREVQADRWSWHKAIPETQPHDWSVFNTGAEVASGLSYKEAMEYMTLPRIERGWSAVCVINADNLEKEADR